MSVLLVNAEAGRVPLGDGVVHCSVSSPPYFSLRQYEGDQARTWPEVSYAPMPGLPKLVIPAMCCALGHESTPEAFIGHLVACYREVWRVSREDSAHWLIVGDSYCSQGGFRDYGSHDGATGRKFNSGQRGSGKGLKPGDLMLIPHRLALALQADGWTVRNDCVWQKVAPMPESVQGIRWQRCRVKVNKSQRGKEAYPTNAYSLPQGDHKNGVIDGSATWQDCPGCPRCESTGGYVLRRGSWRHTRAHETILHLSKGMGYWSDGEAVRERLSQSSINRINQPTFDQQTGGDKDYRSGVNANRSMRKTLENFADNPSGRNPRSVLTPKPESYSGKHYAVFSTSLIRPLIKSSCPVRCCPACGAGWAPQIEKPDMSQRPTRSNDAKTMLTDDIHISNGWAGYPKSAGQQYQEWRNANPDVVIDYLPTCTCTRKLAEQYTGDGPQTGAEWLRRLAEAAEQLAPVPGIVLDPFFGSGTTGIVARELGVECIGLDLSYDYLSQQARSRLELDKLDEWQHGKNGKESKPLEDLPLFAEL